jgi:protein-S-isoprenylcysteine O-methyltransferase Ste14
MRYEGVPTAQVRNFDGRPQEPLLYYLAGVLLIGEMAMFALLGEPLWILEHRALGALLVVVAWAIWALGLVLIVLPMSTLRSKGGVARAASHVHTRILVQTGICALVRHPLYLGCTLMYYPLVGFRPRALLALVAVLGTAIVRRISRQEDRQLIGLFGERYEACVASTPGMNLPAGVVRLLLARYIRMEAPLRFVAHSRPDGTAPGDTRGEMVSYRKD